MQRMLRAPGADCSIDTGNLLAFFYVRCATVPVQSIVCTGAAALECTCILIYSHADLQPPVHGYNCCYAGAQPGKDTRLCGSKHPLKLYAGIRLVGQLPSRRPARHCMVYTIHLMCGTSPPITGMVQPTEAAHIQERVCAMHCCVQVAVVGLRARAAGVPGCGACRVRGGAAVGQPAGGAVMGCCCCCYCCLPASCHALSEVLLLKVPPSRDSSLWNLKVRMHTFVFIQPQPVGVGGA